MKETERIKLLVVGEDGPVEIADMPNDLVAFLILKLSERMEQMDEEIGEAQLTRADLQSKIIELNEEVEARKQPKFVRLAKQHLIENPIKNGCNCKISFDLQKGLIKVKMPVCNDDWTNSALNFIMTFTAKYPKAYVRWPNNPEPQVMYIDCHDFE